MGFIYCVVLKGVEILEACFGHSVDEAAVWSVEEDVVGVSRVSCGFVRFGRCCV